MAGMKGITINTAPEAEPHIYAEDDAAIYQAIFGGDGVSTIGQACKATVLSNNKVRIADGVICVGGHMARIPYGEYCDCEITNGQSGKNRNDIIVAKFLTTGTGGIDTMTCEVKEGVADTTATDPTLTRDDVYTGGKIRECPLYRVKIEGLSIVAVEQLFDLKPTAEELKELIDETDSEIKILNSKTSYNFDSLYWTNPTYHITKKSGIIHIDYHCVVSGGVPGVSFLVAKLPSSICPKNTIKSQAWTANGSSQRHGASIEIGPNGQICLVAGDSFVEAGFTVSYPL